MSGLRVGIKNGQLVDTIYDPMAIYGALTDLTYPEMFIEKTPFKTNMKQRFENYLPCAFGFFKKKISVGKTLTYNSIIGTTKTEAALNKLVPSITNDDYIARKQLQNGRVVDEVTQYNFTCSRYPEFDFYCRQNFLDNVLRGGIPITYESSTGERNTVPLYSRKHG